MAAITENLNLSIYLFKVKDQYKANPEVILCLFHKLVQKPQTGAIVYWLELRAQSREVVGSNPTSDMTGICLRPAPTQGEFDTGTMGRSSH